MSVRSYQVEPLEEVLAEIDPQKALPPCRIHRLILGSGALTAVADTLSELLEQQPSATRSGRPRVALLVDRTPISRQGLDVKDLVEEQLAGSFDVTRTVLDDGHAELHVVDSVLDDACGAVADVEGVVAVGGGTISDIAKVAAADGRGLPLVSVQTAASVDGYTDDVSVVLRDGVKRTVASRWPDAVIADAETIAEAPAAMNRAGYGEMTSMLVAPADWRLASLVGVDETFHPGPLRLLRRVGADIESWSPGVATGDVTSVAALTRALALRGVATGVAGTTAVLSGVEHLVSHMLDQHHTQHHLPMGLHGAQVGVASVVAAAAWELLFERLSTRPLPVLVDDATRAAAGRAEVERAFGALDSTGMIASECWQDYAKKLQRVAACRSKIEQLLADWSEHEQELRGLVTPSRDIARGLRRAGAAARFADLTPSVESGLARWAVANCALMRNRFTVVDLLTSLGWWQPEDVDEALDRASRAVSAAERD